MKQFFIASLTLSLALSPVFVFAQTTSTLQRFQPNVTLTSGNNASGFGGVSFSGVGSAVLKCSGTTKAIGNAINDLGGTKSSGGVLGGIGKALGISAGGAGIAKVPTTDSGVEAENKKANKKEECYDAVAYTLAKSALQQVTNKTLNWVNTGFGGNPFYLRDVDSFLHGIEKEKLRSYLGVISESGNQVINQSVSNQLISIFSGKPVVKTETLPKTEEEKKYVAFSKDFTKGGWDSWFNITQGDQNPLGQFLIVSEQYARDTGKEKENIKQELAQGNGFLSQKKCVEYAPARSTDDSYDFNTNPDGSPKCLKYETVTPGAIIADQTKQVTSSGIRQLEAADELNEVIGSYLDKFLNALFNKGLQTLGRSSGDNFGNSLSGFGGVGSNVVVGSNGQPINGTGSGISLPFNQSGSGYDVSEFNISNPRHIAAVIKVQKDFQSQALDSRAALDKIVPNLGYLDYCFPGPNSAWQNDLDSNLDAFSTAIISGTADISNSGNGSIATTPYTLANSMLQKTKTMPTKTLVVSNGPVTTTQGSGGSGFGIIGGIIGLIAGTTHDTSAVAPATASVFSTWKDDLITTINNQFDLNTISAAFAQTQQTSAQQAFARGFVRDASTQLRLLPGYIESTVNTDDQYQQALDTTEVNIDQLEAIRSEVLDIVKTARARHIAAKRTQGITVNTTCLDQNYDISNNPIVGTSRSESDADALLDTMEAAQTTFYNNL